MMTPTTFDMPDAIDEPVDEMQELLSDEQAGEEASDEQAGELGQVEDAEPGQDWNAEGVFIGAAEIIEVPFRKTVKSKATVRVVFDREQGNHWRSGWHWKSLLKNDSGKMSEVGKELSREFIGYASKAEAVNDALSHMASHSADFDKRISDDILKFRDTDWHVVDAGNDDAADGEPADDEPLERHATEPRANAFDVLDTEVETVGIPLPKKLKAVAFTLLAHDSQGWWRFGYSYEFNGLGSSGPPKLDGEKFPSRKQAQCAALRHCIGHFTNLNTGFSLDVADKVALLLQSVERDATEEITARELATDPETKAAIDELGIAGVSVGEPVATPAATPTEAELQAKAEAEFRRKYIAAAELMADAVLERRHAESIFKTAKAKEKCCAEMLEQLADKGPERLPLFEAAEREQAKASITDPRTGETTTATFTRENPSDAWKSASVTELNLPKGVESKLVGDGIDTIGRLEQRRADVANKREKYPAGIGKAAIDKIEDAVLAWLKVNQHADQATEVEPVEVPAEAAAAAEATTDKVIDPEIGDVAARLDELYGDVEFMCERTNGSYGSGRDAYDRGDMLTDCPLTPGDEQDQWLMGWADAKEADRELE